MKKYLAIFGAAVLVMTLAAPVMAQFTSWGHMEIQTVWERNPDFNTGRTFYSPGGLPSGENVKTLQDRDLAFRVLAERFRFYLQYGDPKTVRAVIGFEADSSDWGELRTSGTVTGGKMGAYTADTVQLEIKHAYLDFVIPNTPLTVTAGIQGWNYGGRLFVNNDAPGVKVAANFAPHKIEAFWWRQNDANRWSYGVNDTYGAAWNMSQQIFDIYAWGAYKNDLFTGVSGVPAANQFSDHPWWAAVGGGFRPGNWNFSAQGVYVGGKRDYVVETATQKSADYTAYAIEAAAKFQIGPGMFVGVEGFYSSGNDADNLDKIKLYQDATASEGRSIFGNDRTVFFWMNAAQMGYYHNSVLDFAGMWYGRANFEFSPLAWLRFNLNYLYIGDNTKGTPSPASVTTGRKVVNSPLGARTDEDKKNVGQEINLITTLNIYKNFVYNIGIYYFLAGDVYDTKTKSADDSYGLNTKLVYAF